MLSRHNVRLLTYNMMMIPWLVGATSDKYASCSQAERCEDIVSCLENYDVVCVQECFGGLMSEIRDWFKAAVTKAGFFYIHSDD